MGSGNDGVIRLLNRDFLGGFTGRSDARLAENVVHSIPNPGCWPKSGARRRVRARKGADGEGSRVMAVEEMNRRQFLGAAVGAGAALAGPRLAFARSVAPPRVLGANDRVRVAVLGPGDRAQSLISDFLKFAGSLNMDLAGVCDLWPRRLEAQAAKWSQATGHPIDRYRNTEELYEAKEIDALIIATPDFSHAPLCSEAVRNGKHVYVEKPLANTIEDAREVREAVHETGRIVQVGTQRRSDGKYIGAAQFIRSGQFGKVIAVEMHWNVNQPDRWRRPGEVARLTEDVAQVRFPVKDAWRRYRLNRPDEPFDPRKYLEFRLFWPYSSGLPCQWMSHQIDTVAWLTGDPYPHSCVASGGIYQWNDGRRNPDTFTAVYEYPSGFQVQYHARQSNGFGGTSETYFSNWGTLDLDHGVITGAGGGGAGTKLTEQAIPAAEGIDHMRNWMECLRSRKQPNADIDAGYSHAVAVSMAVRALQSGKRVSFDPKRQRLTGV